MEFTPELWASVISLASYLGLMLLSWTTGRYRVLAAIVGIGGLAMLIMLDVLAGYNTNDAGLGRDLVMLTVLKGVFFFLISMMVERIFRLYLQYKHANKVPESPMDKVYRERFEREMRGVKSHDDTAPKS